MDVNDVYEIVKFAVKKNQNGNVPPATFNRVINLASHEYAAFLCGNMEGYQPGRPLPRMEYGSNRTSRQRLTPVIYGYILNINAVTGIAPYPLDYIQTDSMNSIYGVTAIRFVQQQHLAGVYNSTIDPIANNPIYLIKDIGFQFYPTTLWQSKLSYVRIPPPIEWAYTLDGNGRPIYDAANSKQPVWDEAAIMEVIVRCLQLIGLNLQMATVMGYAQEIKQIGQ